jgi:hypothetical protein
MKQLLYPYLRPLNPLHASFALTVRQTLRMGHAGAFRIAAAPLRPQLVQEITGRSDLLDLAPQMLRHAPGQHDRQCAARLLSRCEFAAGFYAPKVSTLVLAKLLRTSPGERGSE